MSAWSYVALLKRQTTRHSDRLLAFVDALQRDEGLTILHQSETLLVLGSRHLPHITLTSGRGIILGYLFEQTSSTRVDTASDQLDALAEDLLRTHWGGYVALRTHHATPEVLRDPSGTLPCYHTAMDDVHIMTSIPRLFFDHGLKAAEIDWAMFAQSLVYRDIKAARTNLREVHEILPGMAGRLFPSGLETRCVWSPWSFITPAAGTATFEAAVDSVNRSVTTCLKAWGRCFNRPLVEVSGGLDSSIVAAGIASISDATALTYAAIAGDPDETPYAKAVADHLGIALEVVLPQVDLIDITTSYAADLPRPYARSFTQACDSAAAALAENRDADAFFSGGGGDNVFCYLRSLSPAVDRMKVEGIGRGLLSTISDLATLGETNIWNVAARTARRMLRQPRSRWQRDERFLDPAAIAPLPIPFGHPWTEVPPSALPGKVAHIYSLIHVQNHLEGHRRTRIAPLISPLLSQPIMEACLSVPSWLWCSGGINRAVARAAFASSLPRSIIARQSKGAFDSLTAQILSANRPAFRELLLGGLLVDQHLVDTCAIEATLALPMPDGEAMVRLWALADAEAWARAWAR
ncbi:MAG: asparagine synthase-related protein [Sphingomonas sp.]